MMQKEILGFTEMRDENEKLRVLAQSETNLLSMKGQTHEESESNATVKSEPVVLENSLSENKIELVN